MTGHNGGTEAHESLALATLRSLHEAPAEWQLFGNPVSGLENPVLACKDTHHPGISSNSTIHPLLEATALGVWRCCNQTTPPRPSRSAPRHGCSLLGGSPPHSCVDGPRRYQIVPNILEQPWRAPVCGLLLTYYYLVGKF
ncbi:hypothetical protein CGCF415_v011672 [Colletotrichum fructicola]|nr:hypothetical protein CGCFRS4_v015721 [Colletotrichum fructicola]KAF4896200.1 hypothetical protein CGCF415_v011672 [Colletotrichum fructicola]KAF4933241.1 hypothetical protein CGCF245_v009821 [Colletotrichum fructicola]